MFSCLLIFLFFFFNDTATTEIYTLSLHDALPIFPTYYVNPHAGNAFVLIAFTVVVLGGMGSVTGALLGEHHDGERSEEHTSELQSLRHLVCRLLLEKKKKKIKKKS